MTGTATTPRFRTLSHVECEVILSRNYVGRLAYARGEHIDIIPLHYVFSGDGNGWIYARTAQGTHLEETGNNAVHKSWPVAFEVDEVEGLFSWRSVVVHGSFHAAAPGNSEWKTNAAKWDEAARIFRTLIPDAFTDADPTAFRYILLRIQVIEISGREAEPPA